MNPATIFSYMQGHDPSQYLTYILLMHASAVNITPLRPLQKQGERRLRTSEQDFGGVKLVAFMDDSETGGARGGCETLISPLSDDRLEYMKVWILGSGS